MFAKSGWQDIVVVERQKSFREFEKNKSFTYQIDGRGQKLLGQLGLKEQLNDFGVANKGFLATFIKPDGTSKVVSPPIIDPKRVTSYWTTRRSLLTLLHDTIEQRNDGRIKLLYGHTFDGIFKEDGRALARVSGPDNKTKTFRPDLTLGCDGLNSTLRKSLSKIDDIEPSYFEMIEHPSPASELYYKVLNLPTCFDINGGESAVDDHRMTYAINSRFKNSKESIYLFGFPVIDAEQPRCVNIIRLGDHKIWGLDSVEEFYVYMQDAFPQLDIRELVPEQEAKGFITLKPGKFPIPQYSKHLHAHIGTEAQQGHCLLIGDAAHAFPPDLGLGVNSALEDLFELNGILKNSEADLAKVCAAYEERRLPESAALARLVQTVHPYQYGHYPWKLKLWTLRFLFRFGLNKLLPKLVEKHKFMLVQDHNLTFQEIEGSATNVTTGT